MKPECRTFTDEEMREGNLPIDKPIRPLVVLKTGMCIMSGLCADKVLDTEYNERWYSGVNIGNRIFTDGLVKKESEVRYKIIPQGKIPVPAIEPGNSSAVESSLARLRAQNMAFFNLISGKTEVVQEVIVTAVIDGQEYTGTEIIFDNNTLTIRDKNEEVKVINLQNLNEIASQPGPG
ncbi:MAG: hypothetical protein Q8M03_15585 [Legionella sp.]|nr:hypothetical protein [Legionella sp.]